MELLLIYQRVVPEPILKIVQEMWAYEVGMNNSTQEESIEGSPTKQKESSRSGAPSEASSQEWENLTDPGRPAA